MGSLKAALTRFLSDWLKGLLHLPADQTFRFARDAIHLRENLLLELRMIGDPGILRRDTPHGSVEMLEQLTRDAGRNFGAVTPGKRVLVSDQRAAGLLYRYLDRFPVVGR